VTEFTTELRRLGSENGCGPAEHRELMLGAAVAIEQLEQRIAELEAQLPKPISLQDSAPNKGEYVYVLDEIYDEYFEARYDGTFPGGQHKFYTGNDGDGDMNYADKPSHWIKYNFPKPEIKTWKNHSNILWMRGPV
jgi:hypothetical protein